MPWKIVLFSRDSIVKEDIYKLWQPNILSHATNWSTPTSHWRGLWWTIVSACHFSHEYHTVISQQKLPCLDHTDQCSPPTRKLLLNNKTTSPSKYVTMKGIYKGSSWWANNLWFWGKLVHGSIYPLVSDL